MFKDAMDAARERAGLKPLAEAMKEDKQKKLEELRARYGRPPKGQWRKDRERAERAVPFCSAPLSELGKVGWVYIAGAYDREKLVFVKIGYTNAKNPNHRVKQVAQGVPHRVELLAAASGTRELEQAYHREFYKAAVKGEWFEPSPDLLFRVETINARGDCWKATLGQEKASLTFACEAP